MCALVHGGRLIGVVGPSGVGKDSVMQVLAERHACVRLVRRVITRDADAGGEDFEAVGEDVFAARVRSGAFALHWRAHGLRYGVPVAVNEDLAAGHLCLVNLSRSVLREAQAMYPGFAVVHLTAPVPVLADRLAARGRESAEVIAARLSRAGFALPEGMGQVIRVENTGTLEEAAEAVWAQLQPERVAR
ncbi:Ribose 1,5-bisphosphate phosphokinase PhnN [Roseovarius sp. THAF27]|uniref:phosphonate metabolism protein/1,5-bisphosphokinase (PRPP-forming) PhnN n=1 Tax=unclassified Roseovarius TaxID=2614913 RepID=UPI0012696A3E|nr:MULTISPECIES: phosphonate metabolism protein/1,5-bisphosphokinase (PRPP-forming) PhnN [unclassified Roseovarius]QFT82281.1 Ribose 1,5-bisphosphate phosphokinase PhnN [Roseovarius sp. THAF27]QFT98686.1 Ribose 1,5-bisphosphate phosphokinase PhnN [Roseovarius sp. THAF8]